MNTFEFDEMTFVTSPGDGLPDLSAETVDEVSAMRQLYPELAHWSDFAFFYEKCNQTGAQ
ncbi:hypothetical protein J2X14_003808 [Pantoea alhagi]|uniref:hypothetical protein n=1 Tax=Mixta sp. BE291 TaxID=3158787 RepID=UPI0028547FCA|nr:hypothetical protein [Pantoea alhagi]